MTEEEWLEVQNAASSDVTGIVRAQQTRAQIDDELNRRRNQMSEEDAIFADGFGLEPGEAREFHIGDVRIETRVLHRKGVGHADIMGADLLYEIAGRKFVLIQYKQPSGIDRVTGDRAQISRLVAACPNPCPPYSPYLFPTCGAWYAVLGTAERSYLPACAAQECFGPYKSRHRRAFASGASRAVFDELFGRCWIGARTSPSDMAYISWQSFEAGRALFVATQYGTFERWP